MTRLFPCHSHKGGNLLNAQKYYKSLKKRLKFMSIYAFAGGLGVRILYKIKIPNGNFPIGDCFVLKLL